MPLQPIVRPMGHNPIPPAPTAMGYRPPPAPFPTAIHPSAQWGPPRPVKMAEPSYADGSTIWDRIAELERKLRHRGSWFPWRRRRAYAACLALIELRHRAFELIDTPPGIPEPGGLPPRVNPSELIRK